MTVTTSRVPFWFHVIDERFDAYYLNLRTELSNVAEVLKFISSKGLENINLTILNSHLEQKIFKKEKIIFDYFIHKISLIIKRLFKHYDADTNVDIEILMLMFKALKLKYVITLNIFKSFPEFLAGTLLEGYFWVIIKGEGKRSTETSWQKLSLTVSKPSQLMNCNLGKVPKIQLEKRLL